MMLDNVPKRIVLWIMITAMVLHGFVVILSVDGLIVLLFVMDDVG